MLVFAATSLEVMFHLTSQCAVAVRIGTEDIKLQPDCLPKIMHTDTDIRCITYQPAIAISELLTGGSSIVSLAAETWGPIAPHILKPPSLILESTNDYVLK